MTGWPIVDPFFDPFCFSWRTEENFTENAENSTFNIKMEVDFKKSFELVFCSIFFYFIKIFG